MDGRLLSNNVYLLAHIISYRDSINRCLSVLTAKEQAKSISRWEIRYRVRESAPPGHGVCESRRV